MAVGDYPELEDLWNRLDAEVARHPEMEFTWTPAMEAEALPWLPPRHGGEDGDEGETHLDSYGDRRSFPPPSPPRTLLSRSPDLSFLRPHHDGKNGGEGETHRDRDSLYGDAWSIPAASPPRTPPPRSPIMTAIQDNVDPIPDTHLHDENVSAKGCSDGKEAGGDSCSGGN